MSTPQRATTRVFDAELAGKAFDAQTAAAAVALDATALAACGVERRAGRRRVRARDSDAGVISRVVIDGLLARTSRSGCRTSA